MKFGLISLVATLASLLMLAIFGGLGIVRADELVQTGCSSCPAMVITGDELKHKRSNHPGEGTPYPELFQDQVYGKNFTVKIPELKEGTYTVDFEFTEVEMKEAGKRVFSISQGDKIVAKDLDLFKESEGTAKVVKVSTVIKHPGDMISGPLTFKFEAKKNNAKMNVILIQKSGDSSVTCVSARDFVETVDPVAAKIPLISDPLIYTNPDQPMAARIDDLVRRMSLAEKAAQMCNNAPAVPRLGIPAYNYWNEALHGVGRKGIATVFPQAIGLAAMWDEPFHRQVADAISTEGRAKKVGLTFWSPNINIFRDPRWGRGQETYGEDPFLTSRLGVAFIKGIQGDDPKYLKAMACAKHYAVHSSDVGRSARNVEPSFQDLYDTYLPQFEAAVREGGVMNVMAAYNALYGEPCASNRFLLVDTLRTKWGFQGHVVSDCGGVNNIYTAHKTVATPEEASARAVLAGLDLECGTTLRALPRAVQNGLITESRIDEALKRVLEARFRLGMFDPPERVPYSSIPPSKNDCPEHQAMALRAAEESIVLLKNEGLLPLDRTKLKRIAVIGPNADDAEMMNGNYNGTPSKPVTLLAGIKAAAPGAEVVYEKGVPRDLKQGTTLNPDDPSFQKAVEAARSADAVIYLGGIDLKFENEGRDREAIELPACQTAMLKALRGTGKPVVFVNCSGSAIAMPWEAENLPAILQAWYPGQAGGTAVANILFGSVNPSGHLPVTFYRSTEELPPFLDYSMANRTYRYFTGKPLFPFGHGLSYTTLDYGKIGLSRDSVKSTDTISLTIPVTNTGKRDGDEVVQIYYRPTDRKESKLIKALCGFKRITVPAGKTVEVQVEIPVNRFRCWNDEKKDYIIPPGKYVLEVGSSSADIRQTAPVTVEREDG
jgi:beta-glucosidase